MNCTVGNSVQPRHKRLTPGTRQLTGEIGLQDGLERFGMAREEQRARDCRTLDLTPGQPVEIGKA
jgi:hypothetical protein